MTPDPTWVVIVPVKRLTAAKSRLAHPERAALALAMAQDTVAAARDIDHDVVVAVVVVTNDRTARAGIAGIADIADIADIDARVVIIPDTPDTGLNAALTHGAAEAARRWPGAGVAAMSADLAALRPAELRAALLAVPPKRRAMVADAEGTGTVMLAAAPGTALAPRFGPASRAAHVRSGARDLTTPLGRSVPGLRRDVDTLDDLRDALRLGVGPRTRDILTAPAADASVGSGLSQARCTGPNRRSHLPLPPETGTIEGMTELVVNRSEQPQRKPRSALLEPLEAPRPPTPSDLPEDRFINREKSWLDFNARVLALAEDPATPLLECAKFLAIFASNLDEFYMVRVAGLMRREATRLAVLSADGLTSREQLDLISRTATELYERHSRCFSDVVTPALADAGITIRLWSDMTEVQKDRLHAYFNQQVFPVLTPLAVDPAHPFPYISGLSLNLAVTVRTPGGDAERFARVKVPQNVPRLIRVEPDHPRHDSRRLEARGLESDDRDVCFIPLEEVIAAHLSQLFPGMEVVDAHLFRVTRNADLEVEEDEAEDLLQALERELARRRFGPAVRLEVADDVDDNLLDLLMRELEVTSREVMRVRGLLDLSVLWALYDLDRPELKDTPHVRRTHPRLAASEGEQTDFFTVLREGDVLIHHPYDSFTTSVQRFIEQAAADPHVLAIKQTLYRTSGDSPIVDALISAAEAGKQVVVLVEIKARFDETANIRWARELERAGCHVVYGLIGLKTHCKTCLVVRQERGGLRRYCHVGTGNYNPKTARLYEDLGLLTADPDVGADLTDLFNVLTGYSRQTEYRSLLVAPQHMRDGIIQRIERESEAARQGQVSGIRLKINSLVDEEIIDALYRASRAGVPVQCLVRGICGLRPGIPGLSETVHVRSILGRFLEHSRVLEFTSLRECWIGSADMMHRNLDRRIEALVRVGQLSQEPLRVMLDHAFSEGVAGWILQPDGTWYRRSTGPDGEPLSDYQTDLMSPSLRLAYG